MKTLFLMLIVSMLGAGSAWGTAVPFTVIPNSLTFFPNTSGIQVPGFNLPYGLSFLGPIDASPNCADSFGQFTAIQNADAINIGFNASADNDCDFFGMLRLTVVMVVPDFGDPCTVIAPHIEQDGYTVTGASGGTLWVLTRQAETDPISSLCGGDAFHTGAILTYPNGVDPFIAGSDFRTAVPGAGLIDLRSLEAGSLITFEMNLLTQIFVTGDEAASGFTGARVSIQAFPVPEPTMAAALPIGLLALAVMRRRRQCR